jgi:cyclic nucleotide-binding protein/FHA domain-containing protein
VSSDPGGSSRHLVVFRDGQPVFTQGDAGEEMYVIQDGRVEIVFERDDGVAVTLAVLERGDFFGEMAVIEGAPRTATARAKGDCTLLPLRGALFIEMLQRDPEIALRIMRKLCGRIRDLQDRLSDQAAEPLSFIVEAAPGGARTVPVSLGASGPGAAKVRLVHASGTTFELPPVAEIRVGRPDTAVGSVPEVDLTALNQARTVSRAHARILRRDGKLFLLSETGATNGTFVDGDRLEAGAPREIRPGQSVTFGTVTLELQTG